MAQPRRLPHVRRAVVLIVVLVTSPPSLGHTDDASTPFDRLLMDELQILKEEESVSEPYVMTEQDIRESGATDLPTLLRRIIGVGSEPVANSLLVFVDGRPIEINLSDTPTWETIPVTLRDIQRLEMWNASASALAGFHGVDIVIKITTKTPSDVREQRVP